jgi:hypothetical protein
VTFLHCIKCEGSGVDLGEECGDFVADVPGYYLIEFKSSEGSITRLRLSAEAIGALRMLTSDPPNTELFVERSSREKKIGSRCKIAPKAEA